MKKSIMSLLVCVAVLSFSPYAQSSAKNETQAVTTSNRKVISDSYASMIVYVSRGIDPEGTYVLIGSTNATHVTLEIREKLNNHLIGIYTVDKTTSTVTVVFEM